MLDRIDTIRMAREMTAHAGRRAAVIAGNIANADTPGYKARDVQPFAESWRRQAAAPLRATRAGHLQTVGTARVADRLTEEPAGAAPNGNTVSLEDQVFRTAEIRHQQEISVAVYRASLNMLRSAIGRRG